MGLFLVVDDATLALLLCIVLAALLSAYAARARQPLLHPLILTRQAEAGKVRAHGESAVYRNANAPAGFELAGRPRRGADSVGRMLALGGATSAVTGTFGPGSGAAASAASTVTLSLYGERTSAAELLARARRFAAGLHKLCNVPALALAVAADADSLAACAALLVPAESARIALLVAPPGAPRPHALPPAVGARSIAAAFTTAAALEELLRWPLLDASALLVLPDDAQLARAQAAAAGTRFRLATLAQVVDAGAEEPAAEAPTELAALYAHYAAGDAQWVPVSHGALAAGVTAHLAAFSADRIPTRADSLLVHCPSLTDGAELLSPVRTPAGLAMPLLALYTGASLAAAGARGLQAALKAAAPAATMLYASPLAAAELATALDALAAQVPLAVGRLAARSKLYALRHGVCAADTLWDRVHFASIRRYAHIDCVRALTVVDESGRQLGQNTVDALRAFTAAAVMHAYLPTGLRAARSGKPALVTAPAAVSHAADLQAFDAGPATPHHVGPPSVAVELKLVETPASTQRGYTIEPVRAGSDEAQRCRSRWPNDPAGELRIRGKTVAVGTEQEQASEDVWVGNSDVAAFRTNGTLVVAESRLNAEVIHTEPLGSAAPSSRKLKSRAPRPSAAALSILSLGLLSVAAASPAPVQLERRADSGAPNETMIAAARGGLLSAQRPSWVQGTAAAALLELDGANWNYFRGDSNGPVYRAANLDASAGGLPRDVANMAYHAVAAQDAHGRLCSRITGEEVLAAGASLDSSVCAVPVLLAAVQSGQVAKNAPQAGFYVDAAARQLDFVLATNRTRAGAISQRNDDLQIWSDSLYMVSSLAVYGLVYDNQTLLQLAHDQLALYRDALLQPSGLLAHIYDASTGSFSDGSLWATGNGWAAAGFLRTLACIAQSSHSDAMLQQKADLWGWTASLLDAAYTLQDNSTALFHNTMNDTASFQDASGSMLIAYATFRMASMAAQASEHVAAAERVYQATSAHLDAFGHFGPSIQTVDALTFTAPGPTSPEALSFALLLAAARRDYHAGNVTGLYGPGTNNRLPPTMQNGQLAIGSVVAGGAPPRRLSLLLTAAVAAASAFALAL